MISNKIATKRLLTEIYETLIPQYITSLNIVLEEELITIQLQNITIVINKNYPFHSPKVLINNKSYISFLVPPTNCIIEHCNDLGMKCLYCSSIITNQQNHWRPTYTLKHIINEIDSIKELKQKMIYILAVERFLVYYGKKCRRQLNIDRVILEFLFSYDT